MNEQLERENTVGNFENDNVQEMKPWLGALFANYYIFVKKQKRDFEFDKDFPIEELHDLQYTVLLLLNHLGTNKNQEELNENETKENIMQMQNEDVVNVSSKNTVIEAKAE
jgi:GTPase Era involved in 16S rRNA processing